MLYRSTFQTFIGLVVGLIAQTDAERCGMLTDAGLDQGCIDRRSPDAAGGGLPAQRETYEYSAYGFQIGTSTVYRYVARR